MVFMTGALDIQYIQYIFYSGRFEKLFNIFSKIWKRLRLKFAASFFASLAIDLFKVAGLGVGSFVKDGVGGSDPGWILHAWMGNYVTTLPVS